MWLRAIFQWASELNEHKLSSIDSKTVAHIQKHFVQFTAITHGNLLQSCIVVCASDCNRFFEYLRNSEKLERYFQKLKFCEELNEIKIRIEIQIIWKILKNGQNAKRIKKLNNLSNINNNCRERNSVCTIAWLPEIKLRWCVANVLCWIKTAVRCVESSSYSRWHSGCLFCAHWKLKVNCCLISVSYFHTVIRSHHVQSLSTYANERCNVRVRLVASLRCQYLQRYWVHFNIPKCHIRDVATLKKTPK